MSGALDLEVTAMLAISDAVPRLGGEYQFAVEDLKATGTLKSLVLHPPHSSVSSGPNPVSWIPSNRLASIRIEAPVPGGEALMADGKARHIAVYEGAGETPVGAGFTVACGAPRIGLAGEAPQPAHGLTIWMTGLSGAGKTTIATQLERILKPHSRVELLDADVVRTHICKGLGFSEEDRRENVWRLALAASVLAGTGATVLVSAISPYRTARGEARSWIGRFVEVFVNAPLSICEGRDVKGLYRRARNGEIQHFTGIDDPYEPPLHPDVECRTDVESVDESVAKIMAAVARERERWLDTTRQ
jgi:adenylylsulfate kinase